MATARTTYQHVAHVSRRDTAVQISADVTDGMADNIKIRGAVKQHPAVFMSERQARALLEILTPFMEDLELAIKTTRALAARDRERAECPCLLRVQESCP